MAITAFVTGAGTGFGAAGATVIGVAARSTCGPARS
jgi:hypothetical protein